jgi:hypothetical protein
MLRDLVSCAALGLLVACAGVPRQTEVMAAQGVDMSTAELRQRVYELGHRQEGHVEEAVARVFAETRDQDARRAALTWALAAMPAIQEATLQPEPLVAVVDLWALAMQTDRWVREGPGAARLGATRTPVADAVEQMDRESEALTRLVLGRGRAGELPSIRGRIARWSVENPITSPTFARPSASVAWAHGLGVGGRSGPGAFVANTDERLAILNQRLAMLNNNMMTRMRWTVDLLVQDSLGQQNLAALVREGTGALSTERSSFSADLARDLDTAFTQLSGERVALRGDLSALLDRADASARGLVDRLLVGLALVGILLIVVAALAAWIVRRGARRPGPTKPSAELVEARAAT